MQPITLDDTHAAPFVRPDAVEALIFEHGALIDNVLRTKVGDPKALGWVDPKVCADDALIGRIGEIAAEVRERADAFLLIGVGGSNQGARAALHALQRPGTPEILYTGNNLSPKHMRRILARIEGRSVYANVIAKNFATLEPGVCFRMIRHAMEETCGPEKAATRIIATGSPNGSLETLAREKGYRFLPFPLDVGGRFSVLSAVGLLPIAVGGIEIEALRQGAADMAAVVRTVRPMDNPAVRYAAVRNLLLRAGKSIEVLATFEPALDGFAKWWVQLFGESEGKDGTGLFPTACAFTEDLHALGQYIQDGRRILFETFLHLDDPGCGLTIPPDSRTRDGFDYLNGRNFAELNRAAFEATRAAHVEGGVPALTVTVPTLNAYYLGQLFYFFEYACYLSGCLLGVNPFDQPGVEAYKQRMFNALGKR